MNKYKLFLIFIILIQVGCMATPYQRMSFEGVTAGGYSEKLIPDEVTRYELSFNANQHTKIETIISYWERRAGELCPNGYAVERVHAETVKTSLNDSVDTYVSGVPLTIKVNDIISSPYVYGAIECN